MSEEPVKQQVSAQLQAPQFDEMTKTLKSIDSKLGCIQAIIILGFIAGAISVVLTLLSF